LKQFPDLTHWHISLQGEEWNSWQREFRVWKCTDVDFLRVVSAVSGTQSSSWKRTWLTQQEKIRFYQQKPRKFADFSVYELLAKQIPQNTIIQWGNSSPVR